VTKFSAPQQNQLAQIGAFLRENREKQEKSLEDIAIRTYIRPQLLNGIETGNPDTLPEPIFVQGFIRRYGEALGLNGIELSQQFTVTSIPSTPRPAPAAPIPDTPTTRLTRASAASPSIPTPPVAPSIPTLPATSPMANGMAPEDLTLGRLDSDSANANAASAPTPAELSNAFDETIDSNIDSVNETTAADFEAQLNEIIRPDEQPDPAVESLASEVDIPVIDSANSEETTALDPFSESASELASEPVSEPSEEQDFSSMVAAFDKENLDQSEQTAVDAQPPTVENLALDEPAPLNNTLENSSFDDDLPAAFTTESAASAAVPPLSAPPAPEMGRATSLDYADNQPNLKPFVLGGVLAAIALLGVLIASVIGGSRQPSVAENPEAAVEQIEETSELPPLPEETAEADVPASAISDAPVYVEATATREAWVSIIADGETIFEETLQPGDSEVWEAQESLSIYSGDAGALELAANGADAEVMGAPGQPEERIFPESAP